MEHWNHEWLKADYKPDSPLDDSDYVYMYVVIQIKDCNDLLW